MPDVLPDRESLTQPIAHRWLTTSTVYDPNKTAILRPDETLILADPNASGDIVPLMRMLGPAAYGTAPTQPPKIPKPQPSPNPPPKPSNWRPAHRRPVPLWVHALGYAGTCLMGVFGGASLMFIVLSASGHVW
jgi:hypothetical protein